MAVDIKRAQLALHYLAMADRLVEQADPDFEMSESQTALKDAVEALSTDLIRLGVEP